MAYRMKFKDYLHHEMMNFNSYVGKANAILESINDETDLDSIKKFVEQMEYLSSISNDIAIYCRAKYA